MRSIIGSVRLGLYKRESANQIVGRIAQPGASRWELEDVAAWRQRSDRLSHNQTGYNRVARIFGTRQMRRGDCQCDRGSRGGMAVTEMMWEQMMSDDESNSRQQRQQQQRQLTSSLLYLSRYDSRPVGIEHMERMRSIWCSNQNRHARAARQ